MEKPKPQFTEEEADLFIAEIILTQFPIQKITSDLKNEFKNEMKRKGYIKKSLIEEVEEIIKNVEKCFELDIEFSLTRGEFFMFKEAIQELKKLKG